jgi:nitrate/TMAO reductase-like tetraheme cytochrome c subunit
MNAAARLARFAVRHETGLIVLFAAAVALVAFSGFTAANQTTSTCEQCHKGRGAFVSEKKGDAAHAAYREGKAGCVLCHVDRDIYTHLERSAAAAGESAERFTTLTADRREVPVGASDAACLVCHPGARDLRDMRPERMKSPKLAAIGLRMEIGKHYRLKEFDADARARWEVLRDQARRTEAERDEFAFLAKVRATHCAICHERRKTADGAARLDKMVNYFTANPMTCFSCHPDATDGTHPGRKLALPTERVCRRCHNGLVHGRVPFFLADKDDADLRVCVKCHPKYVPPFDTAPGGPAQGERVSRKGGNPRPFVLSGAPALSAGAQSKDAADEKNDPRSQGDR